MGRRPQIEIDPNSGFCAGVIRAVNGAEQCLVEHHRLNDGRRIYSLGAIVHNERELSRLEGLGLITIDKEDLEEITEFSGQDSNCREQTSGSLLVIRAHGEPPETYRQAESLGFEIVDCTCPVVLKIQKDIRAAFEKQCRSGRGQIVIFGKQGHAEVLGLVGQTGGRAVVVEDLSALEERLADGSIDRSVPTELFSQTTKSPDDYDRIIARLRKELGLRLHVHNTICRQVATRHKRLERFAIRHDVIVFVSGKSSSNGHVLCDLCKKVNIRTYYISEPEEIKPEWFRSDDRIGICGATSTPKWLLEEIRDRICDLTK